MRFTGGWRAGIANVELVGGGGGRRAASSWLSPALSCRSGICSVGGRKKWAALCRIRRVYLHRCVAPLLQNIVGIFKLVGLKCRTAAGDGLSLSVCVHRLIYRSQLRIYTEWNGRMMPDGSLASAPGCWGSPPSTLTLSTTTMTCFVYMELWQLFNSYIFQALFDCIYSTI